MARLHRGQALRAGLGFLALAVLMFISGGLFSGLLGIGGFLLWVGIAGAVGLAGFALMAASTFLPYGRREKPTFTQEMMGRERLNYGVYTEGNWMSVLDQKDREDKDARKR